MALLITVKIQHTLSIVRLLNTGSTHVKNVATTKGREKMFTVAKSTHKHSVLTTEMLCVSCQHTWTHPYTAYSKYTRFRFSKV